MKYMLEREVIIRSFKHLLNQYLKNCPSDDQLSEVVSHLFNIFFAPKDFIKRLDDGSVKFKKNSLKQLAEETIVKNINQKIEVLAGTAKVNPESRDETPSKKQRKEKRKNKGFEYGADAGQVVEESREKESGVADINDLLFKQSHQSGDAFVFDSAELFKEPEIALSICDSPECEVLNMTPK